MLAHVNGIANEIVAILSVQCTYFSVILRHILTHAHTKTIYFDSDNFLLQASVLKANSQESTHINTHTSLIYGR